MNSLRHDTDNEIQSSSKRSSGRVSIASFAPNVEGDILVFDHMLNLSAHSH